MLSMISYAEERGEKRGEKKGIKKGENRLGMLRNPQQCVKKFSAISKRYG